MKTKEQLWKLSPSGLYGFTECPSCFWVDNHYRKSPMFPLLLNSAMDSILKSRYDKYRVDKTFPPEAKELLAEGIKPFTDLAQLEEWRKKRSALEVINEKVGYILQGKIDDVLVEADGRLIPTDYKSSGYAPKEDKQRLYRDQLAAYGFMFKKHGHKVSTRAYLLHYFVKDKTNPSLDVKFDSYVDLVKIDLDKIEQKFKDMVKLLNGPYPGHNDACDRCTYHSGRPDACLTT
jgi:predicted RecB family nuclease